jgi:outer membrane protein assembly factor BamB
LLAIMLCGCRFGFDDRPDKTTPDAATPDAVAMIDVCGNASGLADAAPWPLIYGCRTNAGRSGFRGPGGRATSLGPIAIDAGWTGIAIAAGSRAFFSVYNPGNTSAYDIVTGMKQWGTPTPGSLPWLALGAQDDVYVPSDHGVFYCLDAVSGSERWEKQIAGSLQAPMLAQGKVYFGSQTYGVWAVDTAEPHDVKWHYDVPGGGQVGALAYTDGKLYFVDTLASRLFALDAETGDHVFDMAVPGTAVGSPVIGIDAVYVATATAGIAAFELDGSALRWQQPPVSEAVVQPALLANGDLASSTASGLALVLDHRTGEARSFALGGNVNAPPIVGADDTIYFATSSGIAAVDHVNAKVIWQAAMSGKAALADRALVVVPVEGQFAVIGP